MLHPGKLGGSLNLLRFESYSNGAGCFSLSLSLSLSFSSEDVRFRNKDRRSANRVVSSARRDKVFRPRPEGRISSTRDRGEAKLKTSRSLESAHQVLVEICKRDPAS